MHQLLRPAKKEEEVCGSLNETLNLGLGYAVQIIYLLILHKVSDRVMTIRSTTGPRKVLTVAVNISRFNLQQF